MKLSRDATYEKELSRLLTYRANRAGWVGTLEELDKLDTELKEYIQRALKRGIVYIGVTKWHTRNYYHKELGTIYNRIQLYDLTHNKHIRLFYYIYYKNISVRGWRKA